MSSYPAETPDATPAASLSAQALDQSRQGDEGAPAGSPDTGQFLGGNPAPTPAAPGAGGGPGGFSTGRVSTPQVPVGGTNGGAETGTLGGPPAVYVPPGFPAGTYPPAVPVGAAPADGPYIVSVLDSRLPNGELAAVIVAAGTAPANQAAFWLDTSVSPAVLRYFDGSQWDAVGGTGTSFTLTPATTEALGGIIVGAGLAVQPDGTLSVAGSSGGAAQFVYSQMTASGTWVIVHNLGKYPSVTVEDSAGSLWEPGTLTYDSLNQLTLTFSVSFAGTAYLN